MVQHRPRIDAPESAFHEVEGTARKFGLNAPDGYGAALEFVRANLDDFEEYLEAQGNRQTTNDDSDT